MLRSIPSLGHLIMLLGLIMCIYGGLGLYLSGQADPEQWGSVLRALKILLVISTLEGWVDILVAAGPTTFGVWLFYASFIVVAAFVVIDMSIAVVINTLETMCREEAAPRSGWIQPTGGRHAGANRRDPSPTRRPGAVPKAGRIGSSRVPSPLVRIALPYSHDLDVLRFRGPRARTPRA